MCQEYKLEQCEELWRVECGNRTQLEPAISTAHCPRAWGTFADEEDECGVFWKCQDGKANRSGLTSCQPFRIITLLVRDLLLLHFRN